MIVERGLQYVQIHTASVFLRDASKSPRAIAESRYCSGAVELLGNVSDIGQSILSMTKNGRRPGPRNARRNASGTPFRKVEDTVQVFNAEWDEEGVYFYQAFKDSIADYAVEHQAFGGPEFKPLRMTWIKPSFAWMLYRCGYGRKHNQERVLKVKLSHETVAELLTECACQHGGGGTLGRVQWDPERDLFAPEDKKPEPRKMLNKRAIQIGLSGQISEKYVNSVETIEDVTELAKEVGLAHEIKSKEERLAALEKLSLPIERPYMPHCPKEVLQRLLLLPRAETAADVLSETVNHARSAEGSQPKHVEQAQSIADNHTSISTSS